jgi:hypothetical protein
LEPNGAVATIIFAELIELDGSALAGGVGCWPALSIGVCFGKLATVLALVKDAARRFAVAFGHP